MDIADGYGFPSPDDRAVDDVAKCVADVIHRMRWLYPNHPGLRWAAEDAADSVMDLAERLTGVRMDPETREAVRLAVPGKLGRIVAW